MDDVKVDFLLAVFLLLEDFLDIDSAGLSSDFDSIKLSGLIFRDDFLLLPLKVDNLLSDFSVGWSTIDGSLMGCLLSLFDFKDEFSLISRSVFWGSVFSSMGRRLFSFSKILFSGVNGRYSGGFTIVLRRQYFNLFHISETFWSSQL